MPYGPTTTPPPAMPQGNWRPPSAPTPPPMPQQTRLPFGVGQVGIPQQGPGFNTTGTGYGVTVGSTFKKGGKAKKKPVKKMAKGGSASKRADGCATKGKTKGKMV